MLAQHRKAVHRFTASADTVIVPVGSPATPLECLTASAVAAPSPSPVKAEAVVAAMAKGQPDTPGKPTENRARTAEAPAKASPLGWG
ncbi:hypothetical protein OG937_38430 [Streptomyces sp. NBC_00510]